ncbi:16S rRNA (guanine(966)-N(2))-methyltransferase RsmD [candidate division Kazan bacterium]|uniref:16S rRNA (Guanine(966)-N(2))-methyltransferase RsmD n=1 Tax=candidate division Kazan bacterium TaxID=2202143 RepID=A0A420ZD45_UNCK3|nr:MAG: 16S rRNA (guanine(966)-N(2))-methyltransferase RsmD [candidate division Kazan bacterium]
MNLRITGGKFGSRILKSAPTLRPATDKVRKAVFDILGNKVIDTKFLDLFAGSGAVGIEALSRGAAHAVFIEKDRSHYNLIKQNLKLLNIKEATVRLMRVEDFVLANRATYDVIFAAPWYDDALDITGWEDLLADEGVLVIEYRSSAKPPRNPNLRIINQKRYGDTSLAFYTRA